MPRLFVSLDCLADFEAGADTALSMSSREFRELHGEALLWKWLSRTVGFYQRLPWTAEGEALWAAIADPANWSGPPVMILASVPPGGWADEQCRAWVLEHIGPGIPVMTAEPQLLPSYCCEGDVLVDCSERLELDWCQAGGWFIRYHSVQGTVAELAEMVHTLHP